MVKAKQRELQQSSADLLIPSLSGVQVEAICWQFSHPPVFPLAHTCISFFPKIWEQILFFLKKATKNQRTKSNQPSVVPRSWLHALPWLQLQLWCKCWQCQNSSVQWCNKRGRGKQGHSLPCPIWTLHKYCLYLQFHSHIPAVLPIQRLLSWVEAAAQLDFCSPVQTRSLSSGFVSLLLCCVTLHVTLGALDWTEGLSFTQCP